VKKKKKNKMNQLKMKKLLKHQIRKFLLMVNVVKKMVHVQKVNAVLNGDIVVLEMPSVEKVTVFQNLVTVVLKNQLKTILKIKVRKSLLMVNVVLNMVFVQMVYAVLNGDGVDQLQHIVPLMVVFLTSVNVMNQ